MLSAAALDRIAPRVLRCASSEIAKHRSPGCVGSILAKTMPDRRPARYPPEVDDLRECQGVDDTSQGGMEWAAGDGMRASEQVERIGNLSTHEAMSQRTWPNLRCRNRSAEKRQG